MIATRSKIKYFLVFILLALGLLYRLAPVFTDSVHFSFDQGLDIIMVKNLVADHNISLISRYSGLQGVLMGPLWTWILAPGFFLFRGNPASGVITLSIISVICALLTYLLYKKIIGEAAGFITLLFLLFLPVFVGFSKVVLSPHILAYLFPFFVWFSYKSFVEKDTRYFPLLGVFAGIFFQFEIAFAIFVVPVVLVYALVFRSRKLLDLKNIGLAIALFGVTFLPQIAFDFRNHFLITKSLIGFLEGSNNSLFTNALPFWQRVVSRLGTFHEDLTSMVFFVKPGILGISIVLISIFGWIKIISQKDRAKSSLLVLLLILIATFFVSFTIYKGPLWGWYRSGLPFVYLLLLTIPLGFFWDTGGKGKILATLVVLIFFYQSINPLNFEQYQARVEAGNLTGSQSKIIKFILKDSRGKPFSYFAYTPPLYDYIWQYQFWWHSQSKSGISPENLQIGIPLLGIGQTSNNTLKQSGLSYLIVEPNKERPWEPLEFIKQHSKGGKVISKREFPSGLTVIKIQSRP